VTVSNAANGTKVNGTLSADKTTWTSTDVLSYSATYNIDSHAADSSGTTIEQQGKVATLTPRSRPTRMIPAPSSVTQTGVGGGQPIVFQFSCPVKNKAAVEKQLSVVSTPPQTGGWYWVDDKNVHYRPEQYWQPGTTFTVSAKIYGVDFGNGVYGAADRTKTYHVHDSWIAKADGNTEQMQIFHNGQMVNSMPISMGQGCHAHAPRRTSPRSRPRTTPWIPAPTASARPSRAGIAPTRSGPNPSPTTASSYTRTRTASARRRR
jgi:hypothetical protein